MLSEIHRTKGKICSYALECAEGRVYVGYTAKDLEKRMLAHMGKAPGGAQFTKVFPPTGRILSVCVHDTVESAMAAECALWNLWAGILDSEDEPGYDLVRGARLNCVGPLKYRPRGWAPEKEKFAHRKCMSKTLEDTLSGAPGKAWQIRASPCEPKTEKPIGEEQPLASEPPSIEIGT